MFRRTASILLLNVVQTVKPFNISRSAFLQATLFSSSALNAKSLQSMEEPISLLNSVYGKVDSPDFPLPMPADEAGLCADGHQRRYLWTDAFGVLAFTSIADQFESQGNAPQAQKYRQAADKLIDVVHTCLGSPRSNKAVDAMQSDPTTPTGHVGLRIGKLYTRKITDYGMSYDGQYWHYMDKWLLALARAGRAQDGIAIAKSCFPYFFDAGHDGSGWGGGIRWKLSVDATAPDSLARARASDDTLVALIVFSMLQQHAQGDSLEKEIGLLKVALQGYRPRVTDDPLGWGLEAMYDQFIAGHPRQRALASIQANALHPSHLSLPFRLYGAMIGARIAGEAVAPQRTVDKLIQLSLQHEAAVEGREEHSSINRVMLAMCMLCPGALGKRADDPLVTIGPL